MKFTKAVLIPIALAAAVAAEARQTPPTPQQPQPAQSQSAPASTAPCGKQTPPPPPKPGWLEKKAKALACKQNKNLCDLPSSAAEVTGATPQPPPCPANTSPAPPTTKPAPPEKDKPTVPSGAPASGKPVYVCPPKSTLIPNFPYCIYPDLSVVDAIPLPPSMTTPAPAKPAQPNGKP
jgi:hypothetical protein